MRKKLWVKIVSMFVAVTVAIVLLPGLSANAAQKTAADYKKQIEQYEQQLAELRNQQDKEEQYQNTLTKQIETLNDQLEAYQQEVDTLSAKVSAKETDISNLNDKILQLEQDIEQKNDDISLKEQEKQETIEKLKERMKQDYMSGQSSTLDLLLSSSDFGEFMSSIEYIQRIAEHDQDLAVQLLEQIQQIEQAKLEVENDVVELTAQKNEMETVLAELQIQQDEVITAKNNLSATANSIQTKLEESKQTTNGLQTAEVNAQESLQEAKENYENATNAILQAMENNKNNNNSNGGNSGGNNNNGGTGGNNNGGGGSGGNNNSSGWGWPMPTSFRITSGYGPRNYGSGYHYGVDFAAPYGTSIYASRSGTVIVSTYGVSGSGFGGYGNVVVVDHGDGYVTLYAHMCERAVSVGQTVSQGQTLGFVGSTGDSTGNHLHFEVRDSSANRLNPTNFIGTSP